MTVADKTRKAMEESATSRSNALSAENLRMYNAACPKNDGFFQINLIREETARAAEHERYRELFGDIDRLSDDDFSPKDTNIAVRRAASLDALKLYSGSYASLSTPMDRFLAMSPTQDAHPWLAKSALSESGIATADLEALDMRKLASEMAGADADADAEDTKGACPGSPCPSSDTLSVARYMETRKDKKEHGGARNRRKVKMRRRNTMEKQKKSGPPPTAGR